MSLLNRGVLTASPFVRPFYKSILLPSPRMPNRLSQIYNDKSFLFLETIVWIQWSIFNIQMDDISFSLLMLNTVHWKYALRAFMISEAGRREA